MKPLLIRADASSTIGVGHVMRCFSLAQAYLERSGDVHFVKANTSPQVDKRLRAAGCSIHEFHGEQGAAEDADVTLAYMEKLGATWLVVDGYSFTSEYQIRLKEGGAKILLIDDYGHCVRYCTDIVLNQNITAESSMYEVRSPETRLLLGPKYILLREEFRRFGAPPTHEIADEGCKILITLGGGDSNNLTEKLLDAIIALALPGLEIQVIVGAVNPHFEALKEKADAATSIDVYSNVSDLADRMKWCDLAFSAAGSTTWELLFMGVPFYTGYLAENQKAIAHRLNSDNLATSLGNLETATSSEIAQAFLELQKDPVRRGGRSRAGQALVDGQGADRIIDLLVI
jgi:UDP-2,4-diacetamido-2,4,6-trideoxy-beta-L-altropyranose hydrolase